MWYNNVGISLFLFGTIHAFDRRTDGQTNGLTSGSCIAAFFDVFIAAFLYNKSESWGLGLDCFYGAFDVAEVTPTLSFTAIEPVLSIAETRFFTEFTNHCCYRTSCKFSSHLTSFHYEILSFPRDAVILRI